MFSQPVTNATRDATMPPLTLDPAWLREAPQEEIGGFRSLLKALPKISSTRAVAKPTIKVPITKVFPSCWVVSVGIFSVGIFSGSMGRRQGSVGSDDTVSAG
jgi:hypothetical protein